MDLDLSGKRYVIDGTLGLVQRRKLRAWLRGCGAQVPARGRTARRLMARGKVDGLIFGEGAELLALASRHGVAVWDELEVVERLGLMESLNERLTRLRGLLHQGSSAENWTRVCACLELWPEAEGLEVGLDYAEDHLKGWDEGARRGLDRWFLRAASGLMEPRLRIARTAHLSQWGLHAGELKCFVRSEAMAGITSVVFQRCALRRDDMEILSKHLAWPKLKSLTISGQYLGPEHARALASGMALSKLSRLMLPNHTHFAVRGTLEEAHNLRRVPVYYAEPP